MKLSAFIFVLSTSGLPKKINVYVWCIEMVIKSFIIIV